MEVIPEDNSKNIILLNPLLESRREGKGKGREGKGEGKGKGRQAKGEGKGKGEEGRRGGVGQVKRREEGEG